MTVATEPLHAVWAAMKSRCNNPNATGYHLYGGRGITVCADWSSSYTAFRQWALLSGYEPSLQIERVNNDGHYGPDNCCWVTRSEQARNRRSNRPVSAFGETKLLYDWPEDPRCAVRVDTLRARLNRQSGWTPEAAITTPPGQRPRAVPTPCSEPECTKPSRSNGLCNAHYLRLLRSATPGGSRL